ncbi:hypothetical protein FVEN_g12726 [Fusarium venenatum]|nr:hypothetical protein FVEN_g12726 [Fusarium venenatum]
MTPINLPECEGPSLGPFPYNIIDEFRFLEVLNCDSKHGVIVKAKWRNQLYAIKLVSEPRQGQASSSPLRSALSIPTPLDFLKPSSMGSIRFPMAYHLVVEQRLRASGKAAG